jgi:GNAT superfamily N-acetyltransferase
VLIRRATPGDVIAVATVHVRSWQAAYRGLMPDEVLDGLSVERRAGMWRSVLQTELASIYLLPEAWGCGSGRALMARAVGAMREAGYASAVLWVLVGNERARRFYEIAGWSCDGAEKSERFGSATLTETRYRRSL